MSTITLPDRRLTVEEFLAWTERQPEGRFELVSGEVLAMAPERVRHNLVKFAVARALDDAVRTAGLPCTVFTDGVAVAINEHTAREPDASVQCGVDADLDSMLIASPMIVVEVTSPSSERDDTGTKLVEYFSVPSIQHYLIVRPDKSVVVHHQRSGSEIRTRIVGDGMLDLDPPGLSIPLADMFGAR